MHILFSFDEIIPLKLNIVSKKEGGHPPSFYNLNDFLN